MSNVNLHSISREELDLLEDPFEECHYQRLSYKGRSNIYSLAIPDYNFGAIDFREPLPQLSILAALSDGVYILQENNNNWSTITESVDHGEEFTSLDAYYPKNSIDGSFLICYSKTNPDSNTYSLNFSKLAIIEKSIDNKAIEVVDRFCIPVAWAPLKITHANYFDHSQGKPSFIVCSSSQNIYAFIQKSENSFEFTEAPLEDIYPELLFLKECESSILSLTIQTTRNVRFIAAGCQDGTLICKGVRYNSGAYGTLLLLRKLHLLFTPIRIFLQLKNQALLPHLFVNLL
ncbi:hypothetical protein DSO57_1002662 [Entomophthora muscae]|uniref:Uncharacterized protein n=1 Tax=Entomophthora muscae TaxID=34485 RepID=A0ACC2TK15_9FUNG|nr:hypothetical protein DSO57_1002662 [Entomophthora muscae]